jgi:acyl-[acyl-carrier-protein] desaturase
MMEEGFDRDFGCPLEIFAYTAAQELATRISHLRTGQRSDEPIALELCTRIATDENFHFIFYRGVVTEVLAIAPELMLPALMNQLYSFSMPGTGMKKFELRQAVIANAGIYGAREHRDQVIKPLLKHWQIEKITGLKPETQKVQQRLLKLPKLLDRMVERQEKSVTKTD